MRDGQFDGEHRVVRRDRGDERPAAAGDEVDRLVDGVVGRGCSTPGRTPRSRAPHRPSASSKRSSIGATNAPVGGRAVGAAASARRRSRDDPPGVDAACRTCRSTSSRCSSEASGPIVTPSVRGSPTTTFSSRRVRRASTTASTDPVGTIARRIAVHFCPAFDGDLGHQLPHVRVELGGALDGVGAEHRRVDRVGLAREHARRRSAPRRASAGARPSTPTR